MRMHAAITVQPHLKKGKKLTPEKLLPFSWDKPQRRGRSKDKHLELTPEQQRKRMEQLVKNLGDEMI